jgi:hypothetical protein
VDYVEYLRKLPKVELHCHVEGTLVHLNSDDPTMWLDPSDRASLRQELDAEIATLDAQLDAAPS